MWPRHASSHRTASPPASDAQPARPAACAGASSGLSSGLRLSVGLSLSLAVLSACAATSVRERPTGFRHGLGPDLRIFADDQCLPVSMEARSLDFLGEVVTGLTGLAVKSFGRFLEEVGAPDIETASGVLSAHFINTASEPVSFNDTMRCLYVVRDGFQSDRFDPKAPAELKAIWTRLGLGGTPSLFALVRLDQAEANGAPSNHYRASLLEFSAQRFARPGAEGARDYILTLEFVTPGAGRRYTVGDAGEFILPPAGPFATGGFPLRGVSEGQYLREADLKGLETGWMTGPPLETASSGLPVNIYVDVLELKRGNPFLADIGRFLQSPPIVTAAEGEVSAALDETARRQAETQAYATAARTQRGLAQALEEASLDLAARLADPDASPGQLLSAVHGAENAISDIELYRRANGWQSDGAGVTAQIEALRARVDETRRRLSAS